MEYFTYILYSKNIDKFYIGFTSMPVVERVKKHNSNHKGYTRRSNDWECVYIGEFPSKGEAYAREREIKAWKSRKKIEALVSSVQ